MAGVAGRSGGRNAKTRKEHELAGTFRKHRHKDLRNPEPPPGAPAPPKRLTGETLAEWNRMLERLTTSKTLSSVDGGALYQYCRLFDETEKIVARQASTETLIQQLDDAISNLKEGELLQAVQEIVKLKRLEHSYTSQIRQGRMAQRAYLVEFGLTPASRSRVKVQDAPDATDPFAEFDESITH